MENLIIIAILLAIVAYAVLRAVKHFNGGGCCGSGGNTIRIKKTLNGPRIGQKKMNIAGMTCQNCEIRVENALNRLDNVAARVSWKKKSAVIDYSDAVSDDALRAAVERLGYQVIRIE